MSSWQLQKKCEHNSSGTQPSCLYFEQVNRKTLMRTIATHNKCFVLRVNIFAQRQVKIPIKTDLFQNGTFYKALFHNAPCIHQSRTNQVNETDFTFKLTHQWCKIYWEKFFFSWAFLYWLFWMNAANLKLGNCHFCPIFASHLE